MALTNQQMLQQALSSNIAALAAMYANPRPDYSLDGRTYSWDRLRANLLAEQDQLRKQIQAEDGPFECVVNGV